MAAGRRPGRARTTGLAVTPAAGGEAEAVARRDGPAQYDARPPAEVRRRLEWLERGGAVTTTRACACC